MATNYGLVNRERFTTSIDKELIAKLKDYSEKSMIPVSRLMDVAIKNFLEGTSDRN